MIVEKLPDLGLPDYGEVRDAARPILSLSWKADGPHRAAAHRHPRAHVIFPESGVYWVTTQQGSWLVPSGQAIWIPPRAYHEVYSNGPVTARILFVDEAHAGSLPARSGTVKVSALLTALVLRAADYGNDYRPGGPESRLAKVLLDELAALELAPLLLPVSKDPRLARAMDQLIEQPSSNAPLDEIARASGASARTLNRLFRSETGMTFAQWRTRLVLVQSIERLSRGVSVTEVAVDFGYRSVSSFTYMFRRNMGVPPGRYGKREASNEPGIVA